MNFEVGGVALAGQWTFLAQYGCQDVRRAAHVSVAEVNGMDIVVGTAHRNFDGKGRLCSNVSIQSHDNRTFTALPLLAIGLHINVSLDLSAFRWPDLWPRSSGRPAPVAKADPSVGDVLASVRIPEGGGFVAAPCRVLGLDARDGLVITDSGGGLGWSGRGQWEQDADGNWIFAAVHQGGMSFEGVTAQAEAAEAGEQVKLRSLYEGWKVNGSCNETHLVGPTPSGSEWIPDGFLSCLEDCFHDFGGEAVSRAARWLWEWSLWAAPSATCLPPSAEICEHVDPWAAWA
jgi:hypothetical protein